MLALVLMAQVQDVAAQVSPAWTAEKCLRYTRAWDFATSGGGLSHLSPGFVAAHDAFLAGGCRDRGQVCPVTDAERKLADTLSLMAVAEGMAGSFLPFACPAPGPAAP